MKNNKIAALLQELRVLTGRVEVRDHELADLRDRTSTEIRAKGEVIVQLNDTICTVRNELDVANSWLGRERSAREAAEVSLEASRKQVEGKLDCPCLCSYFRFSAFC